MHSHTTYSGYEVRGKPLKKTPAPLCPEHNANANLTCPFALSCPRASLETVAPVAHSWNQNHGLQCVPFRNKGQLKRACKHHDCSCLPPSPAPRRAGPNRQLPMPWRNPLLQGWFYKCADHWSNHCSCLAGVRRRRAGPRGAVWPEGALVGHLCTHASQ